MRHVGYEGRMLCELYPYLFLLVLGQWDFVFLLLEKR